MVTPEKFPEDADHDLFIHGGDNAGRIPWKEGEKLDENWRETIRLLAAKLMEIVGEEEPKPPEPGVPDRLYRCPSCQREVEAGFRGVKKCEGCGKVFRISLKSAAENVLAIFPRADIFSCVDTATTRTTDQEQRK